MINNAFRTKHHFMISTNIPVVFIWMMLTSLLFHSFFLRFKVYIPFRVTVELMQQILVAWFPYPIFIHNRIIIWFRFTILIQNFLGLLFLLFVPCEGIRLSFSKCLFFFKITVLHFIVVFRSERLLGTRVADCSPFPLFLSARYFHS